MGPARATLTAPKNYALLHLVQKIPVPGKGLVAKSFHTGDKSRNEIFTK